MIPKQLADETNLLRAGGVNVDAIEADGFINLIIHDFELPHGLNKTKCERLLIRVPVAYPNGRPDMFWTEEDVTLANGTIVKKSDVFETILGQKWRRFSWHPQNWNPGTDNLGTFIEFIVTGLTKAITQA